MNTPRPTFSSSRFRSQAIASSSLLLLVLAIPLASASNVPHVFEVGEIIRASELNDNFESLFVDQDLTIEILPKDGCAGLQAELHRLGRRRIVDGATVTLELAPGFYTCESSIEVDHSDGRHIHIRGSGNGPDEVVLSFPPSHSGFTVRGGRTLGMLHNLTIDGGHSDGAGWTAGILIDGISSTTLDTIVVRNFWSGINASRGSRINGTEITSTENHDWGYISIGNSIVELSSSTATQNGAGFLAASGGMLSLSSGSASNNDGVGFLARHGASMGLTDSQSLGNASTGFYSVLGSTISVDDGAAVNNGQSGFAVGRHATMTVSDVDSSDNGSFGYFSFQGGFLGRYGGYYSSNNGDGDTNMIPGSINLDEGAVIHGS